MAKIEEIDDEEMENFLRRYLILKTGETRSPAETRKEIRSKVEKATTDKAILEIASDIGDAATAYREYLDIVKVGGKSKFEKRLVVLHVGKLQQHLPMMIALLARNDRKKIEKDAIKLLDVIEAIHINHNVIDNQIAADFEDLFAKAAPQCAEGALDKAIATLTEGFDKKINDDLRPREGFVQKLSKADLSESAAQLMLRRMEKARWSGDEHVLGVDEPKRANLEHILPKKPSEEWDEKWQDEDLHDQYIARIGNLTLLSEPLNKGVKNSGFSKKLEYYKKSDVRLTSQDLAKTGTWDIPQIEARSLALAKEAAELWAWEIYTARKK